jgi:hypothetical protein
MGTVRRYLIVEALAFFAAALIHAGLLVPGYAHRAARIAETVLGIALLAGLTVSLLQPARTRSAGLVAQGFALLGTLVGILTMVIGVGPQSTPDVIYHLAMVALLGWGLGTTARTTPDTRSA